MTPAERRTAIIRVLAEIDQQIAETESLLLDDELDASERRYMILDLDFRRKSLVKVEAMLSKMDGRE